MRRGQRDQDHRSSLQRGRYRCALSDGLPVRALALTPIALCLCSTSRSWSACCQSSAGRALRIRSVTAPRASSAAKTSAFMTGRAANRVSNEHSGLVVPPRRKSQTMLLLADEYHLGFSRDGFFFSRPPPISSPGSRAQLNVPPPPGPKLCRPCLTKCDSCATGPGPYRTPFIPQNEAAEGGWSFGNVQTVAGGFVVDESTLRFYFSARSSNAFGNTTAYTGTALLRRGELAITLGLSEGCHDTYTNAALQTALRACRLLLAAPRGSSPRGRCGSTHSTCLRTALPHRCG